MIVRVNEALCLQHYLDTARKHPDFYVGSGTYTGEEVNELYVSVDSEYRLIGYFALNIDGSTCRNVAMISTTPSMTYLNDARELVSRLAREYDSTYFYCKASGRGRNLIEYLSKDKKLGITKVGEKVINGTLVHLFVGGNKYEKV